MTFRENVESATSRRPFQIFPMTMTMNQSKKKNNRTQRKWKTSFCSKEKEKTFDVLEQKIFRGFSFQQMKKQFQFLSAVADAVNK